MTAADRTARKAYAAGQWVELRDRLQTVTPQAIGRAVIAVGRDGRGPLADDRLVAGGPAVHRRRHRRPTSSCPSSTPWTG